MSAKTEPTPTPKPRAARLPPSSTDRKIAQSRRLLRALEPLAVGAEEQLAGLSMLKGAHDRGEIADLAEVVRVAATTDDLAAAIRYASALLGDA